MCVPQKLASDTADKDTSPGRYNYSVHTTQRHTAKAVSTSAALINWARPMRCVQPRCFWHTTAAVTTIEISRLSVSTGWTFWHAWHHVILSTPVGVLQNVTCMYTVVSFTCINVKNCCFIGLTMCLCVRPTAKWHIQQQKYFHQLKCPGYSTEFLSTTL